MKVPEAPKIRTAPTKKREADTYLVKRASGNLVWLDPEYPTTAFTRPIKMDKKTWMSLGGPERILVTFEVDR